MKNEAMRTNTLLQLTCNNIKPLEGNTIAPPLEEGKMYRTQEVFKCDCGQVHYHVGLESKFNFVRCYNCKKELPDSGQGGKHWCHPSRFTTLVTQM